MVQPTSRFATVSRRAVLSGIPVTAVLGIAACSTNDAETLATTSSHSSTDSPAADPSTSSAAGPTTATAAPVNDPIPDSAAMTVAFTFEASASSGAGGGPGRGGMVRNPYIAVWIEDSSGTLVKTLALWSMSGNRDRWLNSLSRFYPLAAANAVASSGTRAPGSYTLQWDGTDLQGNRVGAGSYLVNIEAAREHGPYDYVSATLDVGSSAFSQELTADGELTAASVNYTV